MQTLKLRFWLKNSIMHEKEMCFAVVRVHGSAALAREECLDCS